MSKDAKSKIRANDVYRSITRVLEEFGIDRHEVVDQRPHPYIRFTYRGEGRTFHFAGTPSSFRTPTVTESKLRRMLGMIQATTKPDEPVALVGRVENHSATDAARNPVVTIRDGEAFTNSRDVAAFFAKEHRDVLKAIDNLLASEPDLGLRNFAQGSYVLPSTGAQQHRCFDMNRDGFTLLAMGFTGGSALKWKLQYIAAFNAMEAELRNRPVVDPMQVLNDPAAMRGILLSYTEKVIALEAKVAEQQEDVEALDRIATADGSLCVTDAAKTLQIAPKELFRYLRSHGWTYSRPGTADIGYQSHIANGDLEHKVTTVLRADGSEKAATQVRVTPQGLAKLAKLFSRAATAA